MTEAPDFAAEAQAATDEFITGLRQERAGIPDQVAADGELVRRLLEEGGRVRASVRSRATGRHVNVLLIAKRKGADGKFVSRATQEGRVGIGNAVVVFAEDPDRPWPDNRLGSFWLDTGEWKPAPGGDPARQWAAFALLRYGLSDFALDEQAEVFVATQCSRCGKQLTDPVSVERGQGPECAKQPTRSRTAGHALLEE